MISIGEVVVGTEPASLSHGCGMPEAVTCV